jgi:hypothetical protein
VRVCAATSAISSFIMTPASRTGDRWRRPAET